MICEHKLTIEKMFWDGRKKSSKWQSPTKVVFKCLECQTKLLFVYNGEVQ